MNFDLLPRKTQRCTIGPLVSQATDGLKSQDALIKRKRLLDIWHCDAYVEQSLDESICGHLFSSSGGAIGQITSGFEGITASRRHSYPLSFRRASQMWLR